MIAPDLAPEACPWQTMAQAQHVAREKIQHGTAWPSIARHMLGLRHGLPGARLWRQVWSNHALRELPAHRVMELAHAPARRIEPLTLHA